MEVGGASLTSLARHASGSYLGAFFRVVGPLHQRLIAMGGGTNRNVASMLADLAAATFSHNGQPLSPMRIQKPSACSSPLPLMIKPHRNTVAPRGNIISTDGDPASIS